MTRSHMSSPGRLPHPMFSTISHCTVADFIHEPQESQFGRHLVVCLVGEIF